MGLPENYREGISKILVEKKVTRECEACGEKKWTVASQVAITAVSDMDEMPIVASGNIPSAAVVCTNCGYIRFHSLSALGVLDVQAG